MAKDFLNRTWLDFNTARLVTCSTCGALRFRPCVSLQNRQSERTLPHVHRQLAAAKLIFGEQILDNEDNADKFLFNDNWDARIVCENCFSA